MPDLDLGQAHPPTEEVGALGNVDAYFVCTPVNATTFVIHEKDKYGEHPFIYVKLYPSIPVVILVDTGCGGITRGSRPKNLKEFVETQPVSSNHNLALNPRDAAGKALKRYMILCTHCHYDHILGLQHFPYSDIEIVASQEGKSFVDNDLPEHSLCKLLDIPVPRYKVTNWASDSMELHSEDSSLNILCIHTPGHTPDSMAFFDQKERHLHVGDSFYERVAKDGSYEQAIIFPKVGNIIDYMHSLNKLITFVQNRDLDVDFQEIPVMIGCGHVTSAAKGRDILFAVRQLFLNILEQKVPIVHREDKFGEEFVTFREAGDPRFSVSAPMRIVSDARRRTSTGE